MASVTETRPAEFVDHTVQTPTLEKMAPLVDEKSDGKVDIGDGEEEELDLYVPLKMHDGLAYERNPLTARAVVVGILLGCLVNASNLYLGNNLPHVALAHMIQFHVGSVLLTPDDMQVSRRALPSRRLCSELSSAMASSRSWTKSSANSPFSAVRSARRRTASCKPLPPVPVASPVSSWPVFPLCTGSGLWTRHRRKAMAH